MKSSGFPIGIFYDKRAGICDIFLPSIFHETVIAYRSIFPIFYETVIGHLFGKRRSVVQNYTLSKL
jgi:hypothetical protein